MKSSETVATSVTVEELKGGGSAEYEIAASDLDPHSYYDLRLASISGEIEDYIELAKFAARNGMFTRARAEYERVKAMDPQLVEELSQTELPTFLEGIAFDLLASAKLAFMEGDLTEAQRDASTIMTRFPTTKSADDALELLLKIGKKQVESENMALDEAISRHDAAQNVEAKAQAEKHKELLAPAREMVERARKHSEDGFKIFRNTRSERDFESAASWFGRASAKLEEIAKAHPQDQELRALIDGYQVQLKKEIVNAHVNAGNTSMMNQKWDKAAEFADKALAADPDSQYAQAFSDRVDATKMLQLRGKKPIR